MLLCAVLALSLVASAAADASTQMLGRRIEVFSQKKSAASAQRHCEGLGGFLANVDSVAKLESLREGLDADTKESGEYWVGGRTALSMNHMLTGDAISMDTGKYCRCLSDWANRGWNLYSKACWEGRKVICEFAPAPTEEKVVDPTDAPIVVEPVVESTDAPILEPTEPQLDCLEERAKFEKSKLPVEPAFEEGSCTLLAKQCNDEKCFCVSPKKGKRAYGKLEIPLGQSYDCSKKASKCEKALFKVLIKNPEADYIPSCTASGQYEPKQCQQSGACWCVNAKGKTIKKTKNKDGDAVQC